MDHSLTFLVGPKGLRGSPEGVLRGSGGGPEGIRRGSGGGPEGVGWNHGILMISSFSFYLSYHIKNIHIYVFQVLLFSKMYVQFFSLSVQGYVNQTLL